MKITMLALAGALLACSAPDSSLSPTIPNDVRVSARETYIVTVTGDPAGLAFAHDAHYVYRHALNGFAAQLTPHAASALARNDRIRTVTRAGHVKPVPTTDPFQSSPAWNLDRIDQASGRLDDRYYYWPSAGAGVHAYIIDSGIRSTHTDFGGRVIDGVDFVGDGYGTNDCLGHGTHVAGTLGGAIYGVAKATVLHPVRVFDCTNSGVDNSVVIAALDWVIVHAERPAVVNMSLGGPGDPALDQAVENTVAAGIPVAVAAGNYAGGNCALSPARAPSAITVGATNKFDTIYWGGGACLDLYAPGVVILSDWFTSDVATQTLNGTSMAAPHVAGAVALYLARTPEATPAQVISYLLTTATAGVLNQLPANTVNLLLRTHATP